MAAIREGRDDCRDFEQIRGAREPGERLEEDGAGRREGSVWRAGEGGRGGCGGQRAGLGAAREGWAAHYGA